MTTQTVLHHDLPRSQPQQESREVALVRPDRRRPAPEELAAAVAAMAVLGATAVGLRWARRPPAVRTITMGHGGWVSFKGVAATQPAAHRPWWAHLLRAQPLSRSA